MVTARAASASQNSLLKAIAELSERKITRKALQGLVAVAKKDGDLSASDKTMIGDAFVTRKATDKAQAYYKEVLVKQLGFPKAKDVRDSIYGGP